MRLIYVEFGVGMAYDGGAAAWSFDRDLWGRCVQAQTGAEVVEAFRVGHGPACVAETVEGDEQAFARDLEPATGEQLELTLGILDEQRGRALGLLERLPEEVLDRDDPSRRMPAWARWRTVRDTLWHLVDTECRYYLPSLGLPTLERLPDLREELLASAAHVRDVLARMPLDLVSRDAEVWTTTKLLRRLAWHERGELDAVDELLRRWSAA